jgi:hypothetical protein
MNNIKSFSQFEGKVSSEYYISKGAKEVFYTLRCIDGNRDIHQCVLSQDLDKAKEKALNLVGVPVEYNPDSLGRGRYTFVTTEEELNFDGETFPFGKHRGKKISDVAKFDLKYLIYFYYNVKGDLSEDVRAVIEATPEFINNKAQQDELARTEQEAFEQQTYLGIVGRKLKNIEVKLLKTAHFTTAYGTSYIYTFTDTNGNIIVYKGQHQDFTADDRILLKSATIKEHSVYDKQKQTVVSHPIFEVDKKVTVDSFTDAIFYYRRANSAKEVKDILATAKDSLSSDEYKRLSDLVTKDNTDREIYIESYKDAIYFFNMAFDDSEISKVLEIAEDSLSSNDYKRFLAFVNKN